MVTLASHEAPAQAPDRVPSVPRDTAEGRALLQARIALFGRFATLVTLVFGAIGGGAMSLAHPERGAWQWRATAFQLSGSLVYGSIWAIARRARDLSSRTLGVLDVILSLTTALAFVATGWQMPAVTRPELIAVFGIGQALVARAVFIPSTALRSTLVSSLCAAPVVLFSFVYYSTHAGTGLLAGPLAYTYFTTVLCASVVVLASVTSRVIYGLREKVREARELGQYTLIEKIGEGGMGVVYRARHSMLRRRTAVKLLLPDRALQQDLGRFEREAQLTSMLSHPNTVSVFDFGRTPDGVFYYAMEYLDGIDLDLLVRHDGPQPPARVLHLLLQVCGALTEAHEIGLIHRDIKPQNLLLCEAAGLSDVIKVVDFGLVKALTNQTGVELSVTTQFVGTPLYMAPEAITTPDSVDGRSDLYALGAVAYWLLTGTPVFQAKTLLDVCSRHLHSLPDAPSKRLGRELPADLEAIVLGCLEKSPAARPRDARTLRQQLSSCALAQAWTEEDARRWWQQQGARIREAGRSERAKNQPSTGRSTVAIDLADRGN
jgi:eukaryotic-like serine/threonine-protein kinase